MTAATAEKPVEALEDSGVHRDVHLYCKLCTQPEDGFVGLCGHQRTHAQRVHGDQATCLVCLDLRSHHFAEHDRELR